MTKVDQNIVDAYSKSLEGLHTTTKIELIEKLTHSLKKETKEKERLFYESFGAFDDEKPAEKIVKEIKNARRFSSKDIEL